MAHALTSSRRWQHVPAPPADTPGSDGRRWRAVAAVTIFAAACLWASTMTWVERPMDSAPLVFPAVVVAGLAMVRALDRRLPDLALAGILATGLGVRLVGMWYRYKEAADGLEYHTYGTELAASYRSFDFGAEVGRSIPGTGTVRMVSGLVHAVTFDDLASSYAVFTLAAFAGALLFVRAASVAVPGADIRRYALLVMLWPSLALWPSSLGKEAPMVFGLGLASLGAAHLLTHRPGRGTALLVAGLIPVGFVRPHVGLLVVVSLGLAAILRRRPEGGALVALRIAAAVVALVGGLFLVDATAKRFDVDQLGTGDVQSTLVFTADRTSTGAATFDPVVVTSPVQYPLAVVTVLLRPFPTEAGGLEGVATSAEAMALLVLLASSAARLRTALERMRRDAYLLYATAFVALFCYAFAAIGNFGILARQRTQVLPFLLVLVCMVPVATKRWTSYLAERRRRSALVPGARSTAAPPTTSTRPTGPASPPRPSRRFEVVGAPAATEHDPG